MCLRAELTIGRRYRWADKDWAVKVDTDAVVLPSRLRTKMMAREMTSNGVYLESCKYVSYDFFGNLEVVNRMAAQAYIVNINDCVASPDYTIDDI